MTDLEVNYRINDLGAYQLRPLSLMGGQTTAHVVVAGVMALQLAGLGTTSSSPPDSYPRTIGWTNSGWTSAQEESTSKPEQFLDQGGTLSREGIDYESTAMAVRALYGISGLTWEQLAKLFSVSRRAVHLWAAGKPMNAGHEELLSNLLRIVSKLPGKSPSQRRSAILRPSAYGPSIYDQLRMDRANAQVLTQSSFHHVAEEARQH